MNDVAQTSLTLSYGPIFMIVAFSVFVALLMFTLASLLGPKNPTPEKNTPYEAGSESTGAQHVKLSVKFYLTAILFVVFDVEVIFLYPWAVEFKGLGWTGFLVMLPFLVLLGLGMLYEWRKGALEWEE